MLSSEIWYQIFLWAFFTYLFIHSVAAAIAFASLRKHKVARFFPILILVSGVITPICVSLVSSKYKLSFPIVIQKSNYIPGAAIAGVYRAASLRMPPHYALLFGAGQSLLCLVFSYTRILATL